MQVEAAVKALKEALGHIGIKLVEIKIECVVSGDIRHSGSNLRTIHR